MTVNTQGTYRAQISASLGKPCLLCTLLDVSGSMAEAWGRGTGATKAQAVADTVNGVLDTLVTRCSKGERVQEYFDFLIGCYGDAGVSGPDGGAPRLMNVSQLKGTARWEKRWQQMRDGNESFSVEVDAPVFVRPRSSGGTPMDHAFQAAAVVVEEWTRRHADCFPPIICNVTDGQPNDAASTKAAAATLASLGTADGNALIFNCHISETAGQPVLFPATDAGLPDMHARLLFEMSSVLPEAMAARARALGYQLDPGARGFVYNADLDGLVRFLDIGTQVRNLLAAPR